MPQRFESVIENIMKKHDEYAPDAYEFLRQAMDTAAQRFNKDEKNRHLSAEELYLGVCAQALEEYGPLARAVLQHWGIRESRDVGHIVYNLIEAGVFGKQEDDSLEQFYRLPKLAHLLDTPYTD